MQILMLIRYIFLRKNVYLKEMRSKVNYVENLCVVGTCTILKITSPYLQLSNLSNSLTK